MTKNLVIVESPTKAKTLERYLGKGYSVKASLGHIRDLPQKGLGVDTEGDFTPEYVVPDEKKKVVTALRAAKRNAEEIWLATDFDREGEAIAYHLAEVLKVKPEDAKRVTFTEITKSAVQEAFEHPRAIDIRLVEAQQARRILDRLVGYKLSPVLIEEGAPGTVGGARAIRGASPGGGPRAGNPGLRGPGVLDPRRPAVAGWRRAVVPGPAASGGRRSGSRPRRSG